mgnify:CR=1 FL=1
MLMARLMPYRRRAAVDYAHVWAYGRNPDYYDYDKIGGDCTNFASQCIYAGTGVMNYTPTFGWYYIDANNKAPAWTGVEYLHNFLARNEVSPGPVALILDDLSLAEPGDVIQLRFSGDVFQHSPIVVATDFSGDPARILLAAHSYDADFRPLSTYEYEEYRVLHILGYYRDEIENPTESI